MTQQYIVIGSENPVSYAIDTTEERDEARSAMVDAGLTECAVYVGDPECPDSYASGAWFRAE